MASGRVESVWLEPRRPAAVPAAVDAIRHADLVLLGPGSTFTSVVRRLLVPELAAALVEAERLVYICNLEAQPGDQRLPARGPPGRDPRPLPGLRVTTVLCQRPRTRPPQPASCGPSPTSGRPSSTPRWPPTTTPAATTRPAWPAPSRNSPRARMSRGEFTVG